MSHWSPIGRPSPAAIHGPCPRPPPARCRRGHEASVGTREWGEHKRGQHGRTQRERGYDKRPESTGGFVPLEAAERAGRLGQLQALIGLMRPGRAGRRGGPRAGGAPTSRAAWSRCSSGRLQLVRRQRLDPAGRGGTDPHRASAVGARWWAGSTRQRTPSRAPPSAQGATSRGTEGRPSGRQVAGLQPSVAARELVECGAVGVRHAPGRSVGELPGREPRATSALGVSVAVEGPRRLVEQERPSAVSASSSASRREWRSCRSSSTPSRWAMA